MSSNQTKLIYDRIEMRRGPCVNPVGRLELAEFRFDNGLSFPPSYQLFCETFGYGRLGGHFLIYIPLTDHEHPDSFRNQFGDMKALFKDYLTPPLYTSETYFNLAKAAQKINEKP